MNLKADLVTDFLFIEKKNGAIPLKIEFLNSIRIIKNFPRLLLYNMKQYDTNLHQDFLD